MADRNASPGNSRWYRATRLRTSGLAGDKPRMKSPPEAAREPLKLLSVVIPARNEEGCIAATVEHLHVELRLNGVPHEILVVDGGSTDYTPTILQDHPNRTPECRSIRNMREHGFGRAITYGINCVTGDAVVIMM